MRPAQTSGVLIETYWNVNGDYRPGIRRRYKVLIETYWNVNLIIFYPDPVFKEVLIETYWNVNISSAAFLTTSEMY